MQCPKCFEFVPKEPPSDGRHVCPSCGFDVSMMKTMETLHREISDIDQAVQKSLAEASTQLTRSKTLLNDRLQHLKTKLSTLETHLALSAPPTTAAGATAPADTAKAAPGERSTLSAAARPPETAPSDTPPITPPFTAGDVAKAATAAAEAALSSGPGNQAPAPESSSLTQPAESRPSTPSSGVTPPPASPPASDIEDFDLSEIGLGQKWMLIVGVLFIVLGIGFFLKYAFDREWVSPTMQVILAYLAGMGLMGTGEGFRRYGYSTFGLYLIGSGIATFYLTTYSAFHLYKPPVIPDQGLAFAIMVLTTVLACTLSLFYDTKWLAVLGLVGGFMTPILVSTGVDNQVALMTYMTILNVGVLALAIFKDWTLLNYLGFLCTWIIFSGWFNQHYVADKFWTTTLYLNLFFVIYSLLPFAEYLFAASRNPEAEKREFDLASFALSIPNTLWAFGFAFYMIDRQFGQEYVSIVTLAYAFFFAGMANFIYQKNTINLEPFIMLLSMALLSLVITVPLLFKGYLITIFWAAQSLALVWAALRLNNEGLFGGAMLLVFITVAHFVFSDWTDFWLSSHVTFSKHLLDRWATSISLLAILFEMAGMIKEKHPKAESGDYLHGLFTVLLFITLTFEVNVFFDEYYRRYTPAAISVTWSLFSIGMIGIGFAQRLSLVRKCAIGLFIMTILKVFFLDMAEASTPSRIISFIVLGLMLVGASFLYHRYKNELLAALEENKESRS